MVYDNDASVVYTTDGDNNYDMGYTRGGHGLRRRHCDGSSGGPLLIFPFSRVVQLLLLLLIRRVNFFRSIKFFMGGFSLFVASVLSSQLMPRRRLHCLGARSTTTTIRCGGGGGHHTKIFTEPELMAGKGAHKYTLTHTRT